MYRSLLGLRLLKRENLAAIIALISLGTYAVLRFEHGAEAYAVRLTLLSGLILGGIPLAGEIFLKSIRLELGSDLLAGISIIASLILGEYLAGVFVVLMLSGGQVLENYAVYSASSVLNALAARMPSIAHRRKGDTMEDIPLDQVAVDDEVIVLPHEVSPVDGVVITGQGSMDESYLTGEPYNISKGPGSEVLSGAVNGENAFTIRAVRRPVDSRYAKIVRVMQSVQESRPHIRRLADKLGAWYTPLAIALALGAWWYNADATSFLAVLVVATPCPLIIAIPVAIIGAVSLCAKKGIVVRDPGALEVISSCRTVIFDKTGTLTYGRPVLQDEILAPGIERDRLLSVVGSLEQYSRHPLAVAIVEAAEARRVLLHLAQEAHEPPGEGLSGKVNGLDVFVTNRKKALTLGVSESALPPQSSGLECVVLVNGAYAATYRFRDVPRSDSRPFVEHLGEMHGIDNVMIVSGDRESEVRYLADAVGITTVHFSVSPEKKVEIVNDERKRGNVLFIGDGINDAPALSAATVGIALGQKSDVTSEAACAVILESSFVKVDEFFHIAGRMKKIALQSAIGGMALSIVGMCFAAAGYLPPAAGALTQEIIDLLAVTNALRIAYPVKILTDFRPV